MLIKLDKNGTPEGLPIGDNNFRALFPEANFGPILDPIIVQTYGYAIYDFAPQPKCAKYEKVIEIAPTKDNRNIWMQTWSIVPMTDDEKAKVDLVQSQFVRGRRDTFLFQTDWTQISDNKLSEESKESWRSYRQALRDITSQSGFPWNLTWPTKPQ